VPEAEAVEAEVIAVNVANISYTPISASKSASRAATFRYILRQILRSPLKSSLIVAAALFFVVSLGWLSYTIGFTETEIDRLWNETIINAEIITSPDNEGIVTGLQQIFTQAPISPQSVNLLLYSEYVLNYYVEALWVYGFLSSETSRENIVYSNEYWWFYTDLLFGISNIYGFIEENTRNAADDAMGILGEDLQISFAPGFIGADFAYSGDAVPALVRPEFLVERGYSPGDFLLLDHPEITVKIIDTFEGGLSRAINRFGESRNAVVVPLAALQHHADGTVWHGRGGMWSQGNLSYTTARININPTKNRDLQGLQDHMTSPLASNHISPLIGSIALELLVHDDILHNVIGSMEQNLTLLHLLYPIATTAAVIISAAISLLMMLQNAKSAAIMRILGKTKVTSQVTLCAEYVILCTIGAGMGLTFLLAIGTSAQANPLPPTALHLISTLIGATLGVIILNNKTPMEMLQVRE
jgi:hypothetical protein